MADRIDPIRPRTLTSAEAMRYLGVSRWTLQRLRKAGRIVGYHIGAAAVYELASLDAYLDAQRKAESGDGG